MTEIPNDETEDVYKLLRQNNICFKSHVEVLLKKLGFMCITTMSMITDVSNFIISEIEKNRAEFDKVKAQAQQQTQA